ncbi:alpha/beta-Hydrolases superfamily protein [Rhynchospora pubera]|uniref:Alpha/beta-Hydrolases superfamily protein n=1 Tax=Rhynchospora pubera TaxID=906938 RepID=A0AAV8E8V8_9POAL|nr:alpha/beta-Hydrolases superfamily protein [Rhynchospora pubera]
MGSSIQNPFLQIVEHPDGTITRPYVPESPPNPKDAPVLSKDLTLNPSHGTYVRIYLPADAKTKGQKLPIILFFHGGGFVLFSPKDATYHASCEAMATSVQALVISANYRRAPETRLPGAYDDAVEALSWVRSQAANLATADPWLSTHGDFSKFFMMGSSSGGNIAYQAAVRAKSMDLSPIRLSGVIINQPYFGGVERTKSEEGSVNDPVVPLHSNDMLWRLTLPIGADRDHEFANPMKTTGLAEAVGLGKCMVLGLIGDGLYDRQKVFADMLEQKGVDVVKRLDDTGIHAMELFVPPKAEALFREVREFVHGA